MVTTISASFQGLKSNLEVTGLQQSAVSTRQKNIRDAVARRMTVLDSFVTGSYKRHTMIAPLNQADVDVFVVLASEYYARDGYGRLLDRVRNVLRETYPTTPRISRNGQAVTIVFADFVVDVVPGFHRRGGGYLIPSTTEDRWIETNPKAHETFITNANTSHSGHLVPLIKMIKRWNREVGSTLKSFYLELLVEKVLRGVRISDFPSGCRYVFDKGRGAVKYKVADPSGLPDEVGGLLSGSVADAVRRFDTAYSRALQAEAFAFSGRIGDAVGEWRKVFGGAFPAYR
jgi:hypothetical protein